MFVSPLRGWKPEPSQRKYCVFSPAGYEIVRLDVERWGYAIKDVPLLVTELSELLDKLR
jgi:hypothetical protein